MYFVTNGLLHGADSNVGWLFYNQSAAVLGNFIGGALVMATSEHAMNHWMTAIPWEKGHAVGTLAAHDVESSRKANEYRSESEKQQMKNLIRSRTRSRSLTISASPVAMSRALP